MGDDGTKDNGLLNANPNGKKVGSRRRTLRKTKRTRRTKRTRAQKK